MLTAAALAGAIDTLVGLKENVILGHLIPAGTAFNPHLYLKIKHLASPAALSPAAVPPNRGRFVVSAPPPARYHSPVTGGTDDCDYPCFDAVSDV